MISKDKVLQKVIEPAVNNSKEFCNLAYGPAINNSLDFCNLRGGNITVAPFTKGGFGEVGDIFITENSKNQPLRAIVISFKDDGTFVAATLPVIIKTFFKCTLNYTILRKEFKLEDPFSETLFGSMVGHLYDLGVCPFFTKYFGVYFCGGSRNKKCSTITEMASIELIKLLERKVGLATRYPIVIINLLFQYVYTLFVMKYFYGMVHYDTNNRNLMVTLLKNNYNLKGTLIKDYIYKGEKLNDKDYFFLDTMFYEGDTKVYVSIKNYGLMLKLIDYGACSAFLDRSYVKRYKKNITISTADQDLRRINAYDAYLSAGRTQSVSNTIELQYSLINIYEFIFHGLDVVTGTKLVDLSALSDYKVLLEMLDDFTLNFYQNSDLKISTYLRKHPEFKVQQRKGLWEWQSFAHNVGLDKPDLNNPQNLMKGLLRVCGNKSITKVINNTKVKVYYFEDQPNNNFIVFTPTSSSTTINNFSNIAKLTEGGVSLPARMVAQLITKQSLSSTLKKCLYNPLNEDLYKSLTQDSKPIQITQLKPSIITTLFDYYQVQLNNILKIQFTFLHVFHIKNLKRVELNKDVDVWDLVADKYALGLNVGSKTKGKPKGFFYSNSFHNNGTFYICPNTNFAIVYHRKDKIYIVKYSTFMGKHKVVPTTIACNDKPLKVNVIAMMPTIDIDADYWPTGYVPVLDNGKEVTNDDYKWAFTSGPILIWDGKIQVFYEDEQFKSRSVLALDHKERCLLFFIEGPYSSKGLRTTQLAYLISKFNLQKAVILTNEPNASFKVESYEKPVFLMDVPKDEIHPLSLFIR